MHRCLWALSIICGAILSGCGILDTGHSSSDMTLDPTRHAPLPVLYDEPLPTLGLWFGMDGRVMHVLPYSMADQAGIAVGDIILAVDSLPVYVPRSNSQAQRDTLNRNMRAVIDHILELGTANPQHRSAIPLHLTIGRGGEERTILVQAVLIQLSDTPLPTDDPTLPTMVPFQQPEDAWFL